LKLTDYIDENGIQRRVLMPEDSRVSPDEGIPADAFYLLEALYADAPVAFRKELFGHLWTMGLIEPRDYLMPDAVEKYQRALRLTIRHDALSAIRIIKENVT